SGGILPASVSLFPLTMIMNSIVRLPEGQHSSISSRALLRRRTSTARIDIVRIDFRGAIDAPQLTPWIFTFILVGMSRSSRRRQPDRTRARLVEVGFEEIYRRGFQPAGLDTI